MANPFNILIPMSSPILAPRVGKLVIPGRKNILTPHFVTTTSRGAVPHLSQDVIRDHTSIGSLHFSLEDRTCSPSFFQDKREEP
jgi:queuine tRNA-ribosyltransferase subunit QTRTD1